MSSTAMHPAHAVPPPEYIGRYRIDGELGRGGMGSVYRAFEESTGRVVALKLLRVVSDRVTALFEREYHTLASLTHPSVIEVYDFGIDEQGQRYYTMELLAGDDLCALSPMPWRAACEHLRDIATSLALLHTRKLVHRDVSPRNVCIDRAGRAKLIDFGTLSPFGRCHEIAGTPMCMPPEAVRQLALDHRSDLFSLGAVAYLALTGKKPFAISALRDCERAYGIPAAPSALVPDIPSALDELVLALLSIEPHARPASAADVIERLGAIARLDEEPLSQLAQSHLLSTRLCGREAEKAQLAKYLGRAERGQGCSIVIESASGLGRSRLASEAVIDARLLGMTTVSVEAAGHMGPYGVLRAIGSALMNAAPRVAQGTLGPYREELADVVVEVGMRRDPTLPRAAGSSTMVEETRMRVQNAFAEWVLSIAARAPLLVVVDDVELIDPASAGALIGLAHAARGTRLLLISSIRTGSTLPIAVQQLIRTGVRIKLGPLSEAGVDQLVESAFGEAPNRVRLTQWLYSVGYGNPSHSLDLLHNLVQQGVIRYAGGAWALPAELSERDLPESVEDALRMRLRQLSAHALQLARLLALHKGALSLSLCARVLPELEWGTLFSALDELLDHLIVSVSDDSYRLRQQALRDLLLDPLGPDEVMALHLALGSALLAGTQAEPTGASAGHVPVAQLMCTLEAGLHFLKGGDHERGKALLRYASIEFTHRGEGLGDAVPVLEEALAVYRSLPGPEVEQGYLLVPLTLAGTYYDFRLTYRYADQLMELLSVISGIALARRLRSVVGGAAALWLGLGVGMLRFWTTAFRGTARSFREAVLGTISLSTAICGAASPLLDLGLCRRVIDLMQPLGYFPRSHPAWLTYEFQKALCEAIQGQYAEARERCMAALAKLRSPQGVRRLPPDAHVQLEVGVLILVGHMDACRTDGSIHDALRVLDGMTRSSSRQVAVGLRAVYYGSRGERVLYDRFQREVDVLAAQAGCTWRQDLLLARNLWWVHALCEDVTNLKRALRQLELSAEEAPSLRLPRDAARAAYASERGMHTEALARHGEVLAGAAARPGVLNLAYAAVYARILRRAGRPARAREVCESALSRLTDAERGFGVLTAVARIELVRALDALGEHAQALLWLTGLLEEGKAHDNPMIQGLVHHTRAGIALRQGDTEAYQKHRGEMTRWFERAHHPTLMLLPRGLDAQAMRLSAAPSAPAGSCQDPQQDVLDTVRRTFDLCEDPADRLQAALDLIVTRTSAEHGYLYLLEPAGLRFAAPAAGLEPPEALRQELGAHLSRMETERATGAAAVEAPDGAPTVMQTVVQEAGPLPLEEQVLGRPYQALPLCTQQGGVLVPVGAVALVVGEAGVSRVEARFLTEIADILHDAEDVRTVYLGRQPGSHD